MRIYEKGPLLNIQCDFCYRFVSAESEDRVSVIRLNSMASVHGTKAVESELYDVCPSCRPQVKNCLEKLREEIRNEG